ncbi:flagellar hook-length control protein FliK [Rhodobacteraceae bacterium nBUS_24]
MSLANIPLIELNKSVSTSFSGTNSCEESELGEDFSSILTGPLGQKNKKGQILDSPLSEDTQKSEKLTKLVAKLNNANALEQSDLLLEGALEFGGLENLIAEFESQGGKNISLSVAHENYVVENNREVHDFLSLIADFRKQIIKTNESEIHLGSSSTLEPNPGELIQENRVEATPLNLPKHSRTANAAYPNEKLQLTFAKSDFPIELLAQPGSSEKLELSFSSEHSAVLEADPDLSVKPIKLETSISSEHSAGVQDELTEATDTSIPEEKIVKLSSLPATVKEKQIIGDPQPKNTVTDRNLVDKIALSQTTTESEPKRPLVDRSDIHGKQTVSFSTQERKNLKTEKSEKAPSAMKTDGNQNVGQTSEQAAKKISLGNGNKSKFDAVIESLNGKNIKNTTNIKGSKSADQKPVLDERQPTLNVISDPQKYKAFSDDAFRLRSPEMRSTKSSLKGRDKTSFAVSEVTASFTQAIGSSNKSQSSRNAASEVKFEQASVEILAPRPLTVQANSSTASGSNSPSLEILEKWVDSQLDLNSRGWVSNLSKSMLSALARGQQRLTFTLSPESLGKVNVTFAHGVKGLDIRINAERQATASLIGDAEAKLVSSIEAAGQRVASVTCSSSNSFESAYNSSQNSSSNANSENSGEKPKSQTSKPGQSVEKADSTETVGKSNDDDTIVNIMI